MSVEMFIGVVVMGIFYLLIKTEIKEISIWWKQEKKFNQKRRWS